MLKETLAAIFGIESPSKAKPESSIPILPLISDRLPEPIEPIKFGPAPISPLLECGPAPKGKIEWGVTPPTSRLPSEIKLDNDGIVIDQSKEIEDLKKKVKEAEQNLEKNARVIEDWKKKVRSVELNLQADEDFFKGKIKTLRNTLDSRVQSIHDLQKTLKDERNERDAAKTAKTAFDRHHKRLECERDNACDEVTTLQKELEISALHAKTERDDANAELEIQRRNNSKLSLESETVKGVADVLRTELNALKVTLNKSEEQVFKLGVTLSDSVDENDEYKDEINEHKEEIKNLAKELLAERDSLASAEKELVETEQELKEERNIGGEWQKKLEQRINEAIEYRELVDEKNDKIDQHIQAGRLKDIEIGGLKVENGNVNIKNQENVRVLNKTQENLDTASLQLVTRNEDVKILEERVNARVDEIKLLEKMVKARDEETTKLSSTLVFTQKMVKERNEQVTALQRKESSNYSLIKALRADLETRTEERDLYSRGNKELREKIKSFEPKTCESSSERNTIGDAVTMKKPMLIGIGIDAGAGTSKTKIKIEQNKDYKPQEGTTKIDNFKPQQPPKEKYEELKAVGEFITGSGSAEALQSSLRTLIKTEGEEFAKQVVKDIDKTTKEVTQTADQFIHDLARVLGGKS